MDEAILRAINGLSAHPFWATLGVILSSRWMIPIVCAPVAYSLWKKKRLAAAVSIAIAMGGSDMLTSRIVKPIVDRERPCRAEANLVHPVKCGVGRSFPSGHATVSFAFLVSAAPTVAWGWWALTPIALSVALSRVLLGVHYPSDILAGAIVGALFGGLVVWGRRRFEKRPVD